MTDYNKEINYIAEEVSFRFLEGLYHGPGILKWRPQEGFKLEAFVKREGPPLPRKIEYRSLFIIPSDQLCSIRLRLLHSGSAMAPNVPLSTKIGPFYLLDSDYISLHLNRVIFFNKTSAIDKSEQFIGSALLKTKDKPMLFDSVERKTTIAGSDAGESYARSGIRIKEKDLSIVALLDEVKEQLEFHFGFDSGVYSKNYSWRWAEAASFALSMLFGQTMWLLKREIYRSRRFNVEEVRYQGKVYSLGYLSLFNPEAVVKDDFLRLSEFFAHEEEHAETCRNIFRQLIAASKQKSRQAKELLISTILEAVLRNVDNQPFVEGDQSWDIGASIKNFRENFFTNEWKDACDRALRARKRLRHRNAHPDWLFSQGGTLTDEEMEKSLDDMIFLSRFYGYMIKALAGFKNLEPKFPQPHKEWGPLITRTSGQEDHE